MQNKNVPQCYAIKSSTEKKIAKLKDTWIGFDHMVMENTGPVSKYSNLAKTNWKKHILGILHCYFQNLSKICSITIL